MPINYMSGDYGALEAQAGELGTARAQAELATEDRRQARQENMLKFQNDLARLPAKQKAQQQYEFVMALNPETVDNAFGVNDETDPQGHVRGFIRHTQQWLKNHGPEAAPVIFDDFHTQLLSNITGTVTQKARLQAQVDMADTRQRGIEDREAKRKALAADLQKHKETLAAQKEDRTAAETARKEDLAAKEKAHDKQGALLKEQWGALDALASTRETELIELNADLETSEKAPDLPTDKPLTAAANTALNDKRKAKVIAFKARRDLLQRITKQARDAATAALGRHIKFIGMEEGAAGSATGTGAPAGGPKIVKTDADYEALPSGAEFVDEQGKRWRKP